MDELDSSQAFRVAYGRLIRRKREKADLNGAQVARRLGVSRASVSGWERGMALPGIEYRRALIDLLEITDDEIAALERGIYEPEPKGSAA